MHRYVITRTVPGAGNLTANERQAMADKSNEVVAGLAPRAQWITSYVVDDTIFCIYNADNEDTLREHAHLSGFPLDKVQQVHAELDPITHV
jgi:hypothetical protein